VQLKVVTLVKTQRTLPRSNREPVTEGRQKCFNRKKARHVFEAKPEQRGETGELDPDARKPTQQMAVLSLNVSHGPAS
jgi:hypothetical protein